MSALFIILVGYLVKKCLFPQFRCLHGFMPNLIKKSVRVSTAYMLYTIYLEFWKKPVSSCTVQVLFVSVHAVCSRAIGCCAQIHAVKWVTLLNSWKTVLHSAFYQANGIWWKLITMKLILVESTEYGSIMTNSMYWPIKQCLKMLKAL